MQQLMAAGQKPLRALTYYYSRVLERRLSTKQTLSLLNAQLAFLMTVFPVDCSVVLRLACAGWLVAALMRCREVID